MRSGGRVVEGARLESVYTVTPYRGFESLPLRHSFPDIEKPLNALKIFEVSAVGDPLFRQSSRWLERRGLGLVLRPMREIFS